MKNKGHMTVNLIENKNTITDERVDILENRIHDLSESLLAILLKDRSSHKNIIWGTDNYLKYGKNFAHNCFIKVEQITGN